MKDDRSILLNTKIAAQNNRSQFYIIAYKNKDIGGTWLYLTKARFLNMKIIPTLCMHGLKT